MTRSRTPMRSRELKALASLTLAAITATAASTAAAQQNRVRFQLDWRFEGPGSLFVMGQCKGFYKDEGLDVEIVHSTGSMATSQIIATGKEHFGFADAGTMVLARQQQAKVKMIAVVHAKNPFAVVTLERNPIREPKDLEGKIIGIDPGGTLIMFPIFCSLTGIDCKKVTIVTIDNAAKLVLVAVAAAASQSAAAEYFVARTGDDSDGLSAKTAFSSIGKPVALLKPGDTLTVLPGTYFESVSARISGTPAAPIVIRAQRPGTVLIRGDVDAPRFHPAEGRRYTFCADFEKRVEGVAERSTLRSYEPMLSLAEVELTPASFYQEPRAVGVHASGAKGTAQESHAPELQAGRLYVHTSDSAHPDSHALSISVTNGFGLLI